MTQQDILTLYDFNRWANGRTLEAAAALSAEQFVRDLGSSFPSVRDTLAHILGAEWAWLRRWQGESPTTLLRADEFATVAALRDWLAARGGAWATELAPPRAVRFAVNHELAQPDTIVRPGDEVALFPPVTGG